MPNPTQQSLESLLFFSVVSVRETPDLIALPAEVRESVVCRFRPTKSSKQALTLAIFNTNENTSDDSAYAEQGMFFAEVSKVLAITTGMFQADADGILQPKLHTIVSVEEDAVINGFYKLIERIRIKREADVPLAGFNVKRFHIPFLSKRSLVNGIEIPDWFQTQGKKPWEQTALDIMEAWDFGGRSDYTGLAAMAYAFGIRDIQFNPYYLADNLYHQGLDVNDTQLVAGSRAELTATMRLAKKLGGVA